MFNKNKALVVFSGGQDSTTCLGYALAHYKQVSCLTFDYGQRHAIELQAAKDVIAYFEKQTGRTIPHEVVKIGDIFAGMSPLTDHSKDLAAYDSNEQMEAEVGERVETTFVPMRNAVFLMLAANRAAVADCGTLILGVCQADNANYPDCRGVFISAAQMTVNYALGTESPDFGAAGDFSIETPLMYLDKAMSVDLAFGIEHTYKALAYSHTAYDGKYPPTGKDHASVLRAHGFEMAGRPDPLVMRAVKEGLMPLPNRPNYGESALAASGYFAGWEVE